MTKIEMLALTRKYESKWATKFEREVALYIDGQYATRGPASHARLTCRNGWKGWEEVISPSRLTWEIDYSGRGGDEDKEHLCWGTGVRLNCLEIVEWLNNNPT